MGVLPEQQTFRAGLSDIKSVMCLSQRKQPGDRKPLKLSGNTSSKHISAAETFTEAGCNDGEVIGTQINAFALNEEAFCPPVRVRLNDKRVALSRQR